MRTRTLLPSILLGFAASAQGNLDITHSDLGGALQVRVRTTSHFNGVFSSIAFTLRWPTAIGASVGAVTHVPESGITIAPSGPMHQEGAYSYRIYAGFGFTPLADLDASWEAGLEQPIASIVCTACEAIELVNDDFTSAHNGSYYVSLNGENRTGVIYHDISTGIASAAAHAEPRIALWPNPAVDMLWFILPATAAMTSVEVVDASGHLVLSQGVIAMQQSPIDVRQLEPGTYRLRIPGSAFSAPFVKL